MCSEPPLLGQALGGSTSSAVPLCLRGSHKGSLLGAQPPPSCQESLWLGRSIGKVLRPRVQTLVGCGLCDQTSLLLVHWMLVIVEIASLRLAVGGIWTLRALSRSFQEMLGPFL